ncbi:GumC family protein [Yoonia sp.]|uniref:GumC family protein n=1 Tax=Yoonia sp. TaxID=2212373 RepID=UPI003974E064
MTTRNTTGGHRPQDVRIDGVEKIPPLDIFAMLRVVWHGKWLIVCTTIVMIALAGYYTFRIVPPQYAAMATLQLDTPNGALGDARQQPVIGDATLNTKVALATSDKVLTTVITELDLLSDPEFNRYLAPQRPLALRTLRTQIRHFLAGTSEQGRDEPAVLQKTVENLRRTLTVARQPDTYILKITASSGNGPKAALLANTTAALYLTHLETLEMQARTEAEGWLQARVDNLRKQLETERMQIAALIATAQVQEESSLDTLSTQILAADQDLIEAHSMLAVLERAPQGGTARNTAEMTQMRARIGEVAALKGRLSAQLSAQSAGLAQLHQLQLQADATRQLYQTFLDRLHENRLQQGLGTPNAQRIAPAADGTYIGPHKIQLLTIAAMLGVALGVMLVSILHQMHKGIVDGSSLRDATGLPVLVQFSSRALRRLQKGQRTFPLAPGSDLSQALTSMHAAYALMTRGQPAQVLLATSSIQSEGKTQNAILLAHSLAAAGKRVILVGADDNTLLLRSVIGQNVFELAQESWSSGQCDAQSPTLGAAVLVMPASGEQNEALLLDQFATLLKTLRIAYDHIIIDAPPVLHAPRTRLIARQSDAIIYAVRWSKTPLDVVQRGLAALEDIDRPATGLTLSHINIRKMRKLSDDPCINVIGAAQAI